ncbi:MAG: (2Fe-2S)-binding protein [Proteobacteria bacterium]|nr:(2Fe-2S)-binding protein [Pseudomonadota bacterium]
MRVEAEVSRDPRSQRVILVVDDESHQIPAGINLAAALLLLGIRQLRSSPRARQPRGAFCMMGVCQECLVRAEGRLVQACMMPVTEGLRVSIRTPSA